MKFILILCRVTVVQQIQGSSYYKRINDIQRTQTWFHRIRNKLTKKTSISVCILCQNTMNKNKIL
ncbi:unnamed protein product [Paramecium sonneborni]|uniref:Secreted protein n=1 Tax=Paramecium sonneborni TaxID=65129 RepID=A0A8S1RAW5_9CILI|nr:unnamed protein product [Paramecium sonneborni]